MRRSILMAVLLAATALLLLAGAVFADNTTEAAQASVIMQGKAAIVRSSQAQQLRLKTHSADTPGWLLEIALNPVRITLNSSGNQVYQFSGTFTLGTPKQPVTNGTATGWIDNNNTGEINLISGTTSLDVSYAIGGDGTITSQVQGTWPEVPGQSAAPVPPTNHFFWYLSRMSGILAYLLLFVNVCMGLGSKFMNRIMERWRSVDLHKLFGILAMAFLVLHVFSLLGDKYFNFDLVQLLLPFATPYRPLWTALGVVSFYMVLAVTFSSFLRKYIGPRTWRSIHNLSFVLFFLALFHGIMSGTDTTVFWNQWLYISTGTVTVFLFLRRFKGAVLSWL